MQGHRVLTWREGIRDDADSCDTGIGKETLMKTSIMLCLVLLGWGSLAQAALRGEEVSYQAGETQLKGYLAYDDAITAQRPAVLVVHEWWGHNAYARKRARMLADMGYTALAVDMYGDGRQATHPDDAGKFSKQAMQDITVAEARFRAALDLLKAHPSVNPEQTAAIGYCFGGGVVLEMARRGLDLDGVASFHGSLTGKQVAQAGKVKAKLLVLNGAEDPFVKSAQIDAFRAEMEAAGVDFTLINYPGARHSFTNPDADSFGERFSLPLAYHPLVDRQSWTELQVFFNRLFQ